MALISPPNRVLETSTTTGIGTYTLAGAMVGYRPCSDVCVNGDTAYYYVEDVDASGVPTGGYEIGIGTWGTGNTFARTTIHTSSNANAAVSWAAGTRRLSLSLTAAAVSLFAAKGANSDITSLSGLSTALSIAQGGTNANTAAAARTSLGSGATGDAVFLSATNTAAENAMGVTRSLAPNGYRKTGDGNIEQWGSSVLSTNASSAVAVTFPIPFPGACATLVVSNGDTSATLASTSSQLFSLSSFTATFVVGASGVGAGVGVRVNWKATGY